MINIKVARVGGLLEARRVHDVAQAFGAPVWCGGMLETGIGRAFNIHLASLPNFVKPGDTSSSSRYWKQDIIHEALETQDRLDAAAARPRDGRDAQPALPRFDHLDPRGHAPMKTH